jgi:hypothetical protein
MVLNMIKLCVGCDTVEELLEWRAAHDDPNQPWVMRTRQTPKRAGDLMDGGSLYRVFKGVILCRQLILDVNTLGEGVTARCEVTLDPNPIKVAPTPRRAFQGWRYLEGKDSPPDLSIEAFGDVPTELARQLREVGAW